MNNNVPTSTATGPCAFATLMHTRRKPPREKMEPTNGKDKLYNKICRDMADAVAEFPWDMTNDVVSKHMATITNVLWYLDGNKQKINDRSIHTKDVEPLPDRFTQGFDGFNDWRRKKHKAPSLSAVDLKRHSISLFSLVSHSFTRHWNDFRQDLEKLALSMSSYAAFLEQSNTTQQKRQKLKDPVRQIGDYVTLEHKTQADTVLPQYSILDNIFSGRDFYAYLLFDEEKHTNTNAMMDSMQRWRFLKNMQLSVPVDMISYNPGGSVGATVILWRTNPERGHDEVMQRSLQVYEKVRPLLPEFHTRHMRRTFISRYCNLHAVTIPPAILRVLYSELTLDATVDQNKGLDYRIKQAILAEDPDLRHLNEGRPNDTFEQFFDKLSEDLEEITAADERRQNVEHMSHFVSVRDLINQVAGKLPEGTNIPSESSVLLAFVPRNSYKNVAKLYKSRVPLQFKIQTRQLRSSHQDDHFCSALFKYLRHYAVKFRDNISFLCVDDKSKVDYGEPGLNVATGVRGKKSITPVQSALSALDHDMQSKGSFTPSVCLEVEIPDKKDETFYRGIVHVTCKDSIFQPSTPWRHGTEIAAMMEEKTQVPEVLVISQMVAQTTELLTIL